MKTAVLSYSGGLSHGGTPGSPVVPLLARGRGIPTQTEPAQRTLLHALPLRSEPPAGASPAPAAKRTVSTANLEVQSA
jgi:hypothetical protein